MGEVTPDLGTALYLDLLKTVLRRTGFGPANRDPIRDVHVVGWKRHLVRPVQRALRTRGYRLVRPDRSPQSEAETMLSRARLDNVQDCVERVLADDVPGDLIETGVWRGGAVILMRAVLAAHGVTDRTVWVADSFEGFPPDDQRRSELDRGVDFTASLGEDYLTVDLATVKRNFERYGLLDDQVRFLVGWFSDTLATAPIERLSVLRLDGDLYESTMDALEALYPKLSPGGCVIVDDYYFHEPCRRAVDDFRRREGIIDPIVTIDDTGAFWWRGR